MLQSFWRAVKSYRSGACWNIFPRFTLVIVTTDPGVILLYAASAIFLSLNSFVWMNCRCPLSLSALYATASMVWRRSYGSP